MIFSKTFVCFGVLILSICYKEVHLLEINQATTCGQIIALSEGLSGTISYKVGQSYSSNERCVFTLRGPDLSIISFKLLQSGINGPDQYEGVSITGLSKSLSDGIRATQLLRNTSQEISIENVDVIFVTFLSGTAPVGTGFELSYIATPAAIQPTSRRSVDFISKTANGSLDHPQLGEYDDNEFSTFVIAPPEFNVNNSPKLHTEWRMKGLESCRDVMLLFKFYTDIGWSRTDGWCETDTVKMSSHTDLMLMTFTTDSSVVSTGFNLQWYVD